jgi:methylated-DNA-protein-cysteine methyltransferase-like protein
MATPKKKNKAPVKKATRKSGQTSSRQPVSGTARKTRPATGTVTAREKLTVLRPSGKKDDSFFELVHEVARQIPRGRVTSYGAIAACLGARRSARMVGWAMMQTPHAKKPVPAHRVVNSIGLLSGRHHFRPPEKMQQLLEKEGITVKNERVVDFRKLFWDPAKEL